MQYLLGIEEDKWRKHRVPPWQGKGDFPSFASGVHPIGTTGKAVYRLLLARQELGEAQPKGRDNDNRLQAHPSLRQD